MNAVTHGLSAKSIVARGEKPEEFEAFRDAVLPGLAPSNAIEFALAYRTVELLWRLRRFPGLEAHLLTDLLGPRECDMSDLTVEECDQLDVLMKKIKVPPGASGLDTEGAQAKLPRTLEMLGIFGRHETGLMNELIKTLKLFHMLQAERAAAQAEAKTIDGQPGKRSLNSLQ
jgi:hypothetical protein